MSYSSNNLALVRANTDISSFNAGDLSEHTILAYANLLFPFILDNGGNSKVISLTLDILNKEDLKNNTSNLPNKKWVSDERLASDLQYRKPIWAFKEAYHGVKKSRAISNAICFAGQNLTFYVAHQGNLTGHVDNEWLYSKTSVTIKATDVISGTETILHEFEDFESELDDSSRYFTWEVPAKNSESFSSYGFFGLVVLSVEVSCSYYDDASKKKPIDKDVPYLNQNHLQLLVYSGAKEIIEVDAGECDIVNEVPSYNDTLEEIFEKTVFKDLESLNSNSLSTGQKRAIIADQIATLFISQHPVLTADYYPGKVIGFGVSQALQPQKIIDKVITYGKRYPDLVSMVVDRLFGMFAAYKGYNFSVDIEEFINDFQQSNQIVRDPQKVILMDSEGVVHDDLGENGIIFNPYGVDVVNAEAILSTNELIEDMALMNGHVGISDIKITREDNSDVQALDTRIKISFDVDFGAVNIESVDYLLLTEKTLNYSSYSDSNSSSRSHVFDILTPVAYETGSGDVIIAQIDIHDTDSGVFSFVNNQIVYSGDDVPFLYDLKIYQRNDGSGLVDVFYSYRGLSEINMSYVSVKFSNDRVVWHNVSDLRDDIGYGVHSGRRKVTWKPSDLLGIVDVNLPVFCKLILSDTDGNDVSEITGIVNINIGKPSSAVIVKEQMDYSGWVVLECSDIYSLGHDKTKFKLDCDGVAYLVIDGKTIEVGYVDGKFVWDIDGDTHIFDYEGERIVKNINENNYGIVYKGTDSSLFIVDFIDEISSSSSSSTEAMTTSSSLSSSSSST